MTKLTKCITKTISILSMFSLVLASVLGVLPERASAATSYRINSYPEGCYSISSVGNSNLTLGVSGYNNVGSAEITLQRRGNTTNQLILIKRICSGRYSLKLLHSGKYIAIGDTGNGARVFQSSTPTSFEIWYVNGYYSFYAPDYRLALDVASGNFTVGKKIWGYQRNNTTAQLFQMRSVNQPSRNITVSNISAKTNGGYCTISCTVRCANYPITSLSSRWGNSSSATYTPNAFTVNYSYRSPYRVSSKRTYTYKIYAGVGGESQKVVKTIRVRIP